MGDRSYVTLEVPKELKHAAEALFNGDTDKDGENIAEGTHWFGFSEVEHGSLKFLHLLKAQGIAYSSSWEAGGGYNPGTDSCRFTPEGEAVTKEIYDESLGVPMENLLGYIDSPVELRSYILAYQEIVTVLPWDNQVEYGKIYRLRQLVTA